MFLFSLNVRSVVSASIPVHSYIVRLTIFCLEGERTRASVCVCRIFAFVYGDILWCMPNLRENQAKEYDLYSILWSHTFPLHFNIIYKIYVIFLDCFFFLLFLCRCRRRRRHRQRCRSVKSYEANLKIWFGFDVSAHLEYRWICYAMEYINIQIMTKNYSLIEIVWSGKPIKYNWDGKSSTIIIIEPC